ncbi:MAG: hypothetical protein ACBR15_07015 [Microcoleus sp.]
MVQHSTLAYCLPAFNSSLHLDFIVWVGVGVLTQETPLPNLPTSSKATSSNSPAQIPNLTVVFAPTGTLEVNPSLT